MKLLDEVKKIVNDYDLEVTLPEHCKTVYKCTHEEYEELDLWPQKGDAYLMEKYEKHIPPGWYGFAIGKPIPKNWIDCIEETLDLLIKNDPELEIHQIKLKYGGIRFYVYSEKIEDINDISFFIENSMFSKTLIY